MLLLFCALCCADAKSGKVRKRVLRLPPVSVTNPTQLERYMHIYGDQLVFEIRGRDGQSSEYMAIDRTELGGNESPKISISCGGLESVS